MLTLSIPTTIIERKIVAMKIVKTRLHNKFVDNFLANALVIYMKKEIVEIFQYLNFDLVRSHSYRKFLNFEFFFSYWWIFFFNHRCLQQ